MKCPSPALPVLCLGSLLALVVAPAAAEDPCAAFTPAAALAQVNAARASGRPCRQGDTPTARGALSWSPLLAQVAHRQAAWLVSVDELVHTGPLGQPLPQRVAEAGYRHARITENLAQGQAGIAWVLNAWSESPSHCDNLYDPAVSEMALACLPAADGRPLWVLVMARPR